MANPDALLNTIRDLMDRMQDRELRAADTNLPADRLLDDLVYHLAALDEQLSSGGALPREWNVRLHRAADVEGWDMDRGEFIKTSSRFTRLIPPYDRGRARRVAQRARLSDLRRRRK